MVSETPSERQAAWYFKKNHDSKEQEQVHQDWWAGRTYNIFSNEIDKTFCQWVMIVAALLLVAITILDSLGPKNLFLDSIGMRDYLLKNRAVALATFSIFAFAWVMAVFLFSPKPSGAIITLILLSLVFLTSIGSVPGYDLPEFSIGLWWYFFWLFLLTIIAPMICILLGRQLRTKFEKCIADVKLDFEQIKAKALP